MSAPMKKPPINNRVELIIRGDKDFVFQVPPAEAQGIFLIVEKYRVTEDEGDEWVSADAAFKDIYSKYTKKGAALRGARLKEEMTQTELAKKLGITQGDLSKMEYGKRPIGKKMAKRLAKILNIDYRVFL